MADQSVTSPEKISSDFFECDGFERAGFVDDQRDAVFGDGDSVACRRLWTFAFAISFSFGSREDMPISAVPSITEATPVEEPSAAISNATSTPSFAILALNASAICGTIFAPRVSEPLMTIVSVAVA